MDGLGPEAKRRQGLKGEKEGVPRREGTVKGTLGMVQGLEPRERGGVGVLRCNPIASSFLCGAIDLRLWQRRANE